MTENTALTEPQKEAIPPRNDLDGEHRGGTGSEALPGRLKRYGDAKARALAMRSWILDAHEFTGDLDQDAAKARNIAAKLRECGEFLVFRHYWTVDETRLAAACFCRQHLLCPLCAIRRGAKAVDRYLSRWNVVREDRPDLEPWLVTLTVKNGPDLRERFSHLRKSFRTLLDRRRNAIAGRHNHGTSLKAVSGAFYAFEVTNKGKGWHPHVHAFCACEKPFPRDPDGRCPALIEEWREITGDSYIVDARPVSGDPAEAAVEVLKYAVKFSELNLSDNWQAYRTLSGARLLGSLGCFWGVKVPDDLKDELLEDLPYVEFFFRYVQSAKAYSLFNHERKGAC